MGGKWPYSCCFVGCCFQELFSTARRILVKFTSSFSSLHFFSVHMVHPYISINTTAAWKKSSFILSNRSDYYIINSISIVVYVFARHILTSLSVDEIRLTRYVNLSTNFRRPSFRMEMAPSRLRHMFSVYFYCIHMKTNVSSCLLQAMQQRFGFGRCICKKR